MDKIALVGTGLFFTGLLFFVQSHYPEWLEEAEIEKKYKEDKKKMVESGVPSKEAKAKLRPAAHNMKVIGRAVEGCVVAIAMCFSWSVFYGFQMIIAGSSKVFEGEGELLSVVLAMTIAILLMLCLIPLDWLADQDWTDEKTDKAIRSIIDAMALTIGFAWEQCFDACVDALAVDSNGSKNPLVNPHTTKLGLTLFCAGLLVPAWKWYMLPFIVAKGWKYGCILNAKDLGMVAQKMLGANEEEGEEEGEEDVEAKEKKAKQIVKAHEILTETLEKAAGKVRKATSEASPEGGGESGTPYTALEEDDAETLRKKNRQLQQELEKAKQASLKCQQMLDQTMESMFSSLKQMNVTVTKIEQQQ